MSIKLIFYRTLFSQSAASLTMGSLAAFLNQKGIDCELVLLEREGLHNAEKILEGGGDKVNIVIAKPNFKDYSLMFPVLAEMKKQMNIDRVFFCGPYASLNCDTLMADLKWLDGIIVSNIEETSADLVKSFRGNIFDAKCPGGVWRNCRTKKTSRYFPRTNNVRLDNLPFPNRDIEKEEAGSYVNIEASRGCYGQCNFCHIPLMSRLVGTKNLIDNRQPKLVVAEMQELYEKLGKTLFIFNDSCFWRNEKDNERILEFCSELKKRKMPIKFYIYLKCYPSLPDNVLKELAAVGLIRVFLGIENVSSNSQKVFNKKIDMSSYETIKERFDCYNVNIHIGYMVFEPYSAPDDIIKNLAYLRKVDKLWRLGVILEQVRVVPGTAFHKQLIQDGLIDSNLKYDKLTYGYKFQSPETELIFKMIRKIFLVDLGVKSYEYEYYCTTTGLLRDLCGQSDKKIYARLEGDFAEFQKMKEDSMDCIYRFLRKLVRLVREDVCETTEGKATIKKFLDEFDGHYLALKIKHAYIFCVLKEAGRKDLTDSIYRGLDRLS